MNELKIIVHRVLNNITLKNINDENIFSFVLIENKYCLCAHRTLSAYIP